MPLQRAPLFLLLSLAGACLADPLDAEQQDNAIVGGTPTSGDPEVALIYAGFGESGSICSGTLISPRVVLTAAHCLDFGTAPVTHYAYFGSDVISETDPSYMARIDVERFEFDQEFDRDNLFGGHDVGLVLLSAVAPVPPKAYNRMPIDAMVGTSVRLVGWGRTSGTGDDYGYKRYAMSSLSDVSEEIMQYGSSSVNTCQGDSGGANYMTMGGVEMVAGITSFGDVGCDEFGAGTRVDRYAASFIDPFIEANDPPACTADGRCATGCTAVDPDCPCAADGLCDAACTNLDSDPDCPDGCGADGVCVASGCPAPDVDCQDDDSGGGAGGGGAGGGGAGGEDPTDPTDSTPTGGTVTGSCSVSLGPRSDGTNALALLALALVLGYLLRRRQAAYRRWLK